MKYTSLLFCLFCLLCLPAFAGDQDPSAKFYCTAGQIELNDSVIFVHLNDEVYEIDSLLVDQGGLFFTQDKLRCAECRRPLNPKNTCECPIKHS